MRLGRVVGPAAVLGAAVGAAAAAGAQQPAQQGAVSGRVTAAEAGTPLAGVAVRVGGTPLGTTTGPDGRFTVAGVPAGARRVVVQRIGFAPDSQTVAVAAGQTAAAVFALRAVATQLSEVVSIGYGTAERRELTGAVASVTAEELTVAPVPSVDQALVGRAPGVQVVTASGQPGAAPFVRIRGGNSISAGNDPLYVIDGVPVTANLGEATTSTVYSQSVQGANPIAALNPADIESVEVLKDASAAAIYGARAANGVILITTKRGREGRNAVAFGTYVGTQQVRRRLPLLDAQAFAQVVNQAYANAGEAAPISAAEVAAAGRGTDWQAAIFRDAPVRNFDLSFSGGDANTRYYLSGALLRSDGVVIGTGLDRGSVRLNLDQTVSPRFRIGNRLTVSRSEAQVLPNRGGGTDAASVVLNAVTASPLLPVRDSTGEYFTGVNPLSGRPFSNPVASALEITNAERQDRAIGTLFGEYDVAPGLVLRANVGVDYLNSLQNFYSPANTVPGRNFGGTGSRGQAQTTAWLNENTLNYTRQLGGRHDLNLLGGVTIQRVEGERVSGAAQGFSSDRLRENALNAAETFTGVWTGAPRSSLLSYFTRANWNVADRYLLTVTGRVDGSSRFGAGNKYGFFPSAALAWRASEEGFVRRLGAFDDLKLRASYGRTGNQEIGNFQSLALLFSTVYPLGSTRAVGFAPGTLANPDLRWETTDQLNLGADVGVLRNRLALTADYYHKTTRDLLLFVPVPATSGFGTSLQNIGGVRNRGFELGVNTVNLAGAFGWTSQLAVAWNRNRVLDLGPSREIINPGNVGEGANQNPTLLRVGEPTSTFFGYVFERMENGQPVYRDLNGDGRITGDDRAVLGNAQPDHTGGLTNRFTYRGFDLSVFLTWSAGNKLYNINRTILTNAAGTVNQLRDVAAGGAGVRAPRLGNNFDGFASSLFVEDGSFLRGKNIRLGYAIPPALLQRARAVRVSSLGVYVSAQNFFTRTRYSGFDPEITEYANQSLAQGIDFGTYPQARQVTVGFNAGF